MTATKATNKQPVAATEMAQATADAVMRQVVRQMHECVEGLITIGEEHELELPVAGLSVLMLAEQVACLVLEALRTWPVVDQE